jgi:hypothetical protein
MAGHDSPGPEDENRRIAERDQALGAAGPTRWWRIGIVVLGALALVLLIYQLVGGNSARTDVVPGTPVVQSQPPISPNP